MTNQQKSLGGLDSHKDTIHVAVITAFGQPVADREFATTTAGYRRSVAWLIEHGPLQAVGIEGTSSYGVGIASAVTRAGIRVVEVNRTRPAERRKQGKSDRLGSESVDQVNPAAVEAMAEVGIDITGEKPKILTDQAVIASDVVVTMGCGDTCPFYPGKRYEDWVLEDRAGKGVEAVRPIRDEIRRRVEALIAELVPA